MVHFAILLILIMIFIIGCAGTIYYCKENKNSVPLFFSVLLAVFGILSIIDFCVRYLTN